MSLFSGKSILITGAASGIGLAVARYCADHGAARLILVDRDAIPADFAHEAVIGDVRDEALWEGLDLAGLNHAVVNAGVAGAGAIADLSLEAWRHIMSINLDGAFLTLRDAMRAMRGRGGSIVLTASAAGVKAEPGVAAYGASKAALIHLAKVAAKEGAPHRIRVNAIAPAGVETPVWDAIPMFAARAKEIGRDATFAEMAAIATPLGRYARPEEIARQIGFLLSEESALVTGTTLLSDGGYTL
jgi:NAD(P)-dependent dehydrogenase (short-subunit alcohol dehydrogenase family)